MAPRKTSDELVLGHCEFCQDDLKLSNREDFCLCQGYLCREPVPKEYQESNKQYIICKDCVQPVIGSTRAFCPECRFIQKFGKWGDGGFHTTRTAIPENFLEHSENELCAMEIGYGGYRVHDKSKDRTSSLNKRIQEGYLLRNGEEVDYRLIESTFNKLQKEYNDYVDAVHELTSAAKKRSKRAEKEKKDGAPTRKSPAKKSPKKKSPVKDSVTNKKSGDNLITTKEKSKSTEAEAEEEQEEEEVMNCICGDQIDNGGQCVACDSCKKWSHSLCVGYSGKDDEPWFCINCTVKHNQEVPRVKPAGKKEPRTETFETSTSTKATTTTTSRPQHAVKSTKEPDVDDNSSTTSSVKRKRAEEDRDEEDEEPIWSRPKRRRAAAEDSAETAPRPQHAVKSIKEPEANDDGDEEDKGSVYDGAEEQAGSGPSSKQPSASAAETTSSRARRALRPRVEEERPPRSAPSRARVTRSAAAAAASNVVVAAPTPAPPAPRGGVGSRGRQRSWGTDEKDGLNAVMGAIVRRETNRDPRAMGERKWTLAAELLQARNASWVRTGAAIKNYWNRGGRQSSGIDERRHAVNSKRLTTGTRRKR